MQLIPCQICNRTFNKEAIERHSRICEKNANKVRKTFNSENQRKITDEVNSNVNRKPQFKKAPIAPKSNWREKHQDFINNIRAARGVTQAIKEGKKLPPPPPPTINPDYVSCPHCARRFNETAAERHIKFCSDQHKRLEVKMKVRSAITSNVSENNSNRKKYTPPPLSSANRMKRNSPSEMTTRQKSFGRQNNATFKSGMPHSADKKPVSAVSTMKNTHSKKHYPDFVVDLDSTTEGHGRTKTGLRPRQLAGDSTRHNLAQGLEDTYNPSFAFKAQSKSGKTASSDYMDFLNGDYSSIKPDKSKAEKRTRAQKMYSNTASRRFQSGSKSPPVATVAPVKSKTEINSDSLFYEDYNYKPKNNNDIAFTEHTHTNEFNNQLQKLSKYCHECGDKYPLTSAKFCCNCGMRRLLT